MLTRIAVAAACVATALTVTAPAARAQFATMAAHNFEIVMRGVQRHAPSVHHRAAVRQVIDRLGRRGYRSCRVLPSRAAVYRIHCYRGGRPFVVTTAAPSGRILAVRRG